MMMSKIYKFFGLMILGLSANNMFAQCPTPSATASPSIGCSNTVYTLNATSTASVINWYTVPTCGAPTGTSLSGSDYTVMAASSTTYYAEAVTPITAGGSMSIGYTGCTQTITIPPSVSQITIAAYGAQGGTSAYAGGLGGGATAILTVTPGQDIYVTVGGMGTITAGGFNGGGVGGYTPAVTYGGGGGGASDIRINGTALTDRILVAAGGGGSGGATTYGPTPGAGGAGTSCSSPLGYGGSGGGGCAAGSAGGCAGGTAPSYGTGGGGAGVSSGAPIAGSGTGVYGTAGTLGLGGDGGNYTGRNGGGGGGGGYYGGAGGMSGSGGCNGGGGGGSSYADDAILTSITFTGATQTGDGLIEIYGLSGCLSASRTPVEVNLGPAPTISVSGPTAAVCPATTVTLTASGANTYTWSTSSNSTSIVVSPSLTTSYTVQGDVGGCPGTTIETVTVTPAPSLTITGAASICSGGTLNLSVAGADTYTWSTTSNSTSISVTPTANTVYSVSGTSTITGCTSTETKSVTVAANPTVSISGSSTICTGMSATLTANGADTYSWSSGSTNTTIVVTPSATTNYSVTGTNACGSATNAVNIVVTTCTGINELNASKQVQSIYPNPTNGELNVLFSDDSEKTISIMDFSGRQVIQNTVNSNKATLNVGNIANGVYFIKVQTKESTEIFKMIKQ